MSALSNENKFQIGGFLHINFFDSNNEMLSVLQPLNKQSKRQVLVKNL